MFSAYLLKRKLSKVKLAALMNVSPKHVYRMFDNGVASWTWSEVLQVAQILGVPVDTLREFVTYRKGS